MNVTITPTLLRGQLTPPPSKSQSHRVVLAAALSDGICRLKDPAQSADLRATLACIKALGADATADGSIIRGAELVDAPGHDVPAELDCGESGSTLRFLLPIALAKLGRGVFRGHGRLMQRSLEPYFTLFRAKGIAYAQDGDTLTVTGALPSGGYDLRGDVSSQFITGLLYALPLVEGDSELTLTTPLESRGYVDMTLETLRQFGIAVTTIPTGFLIHGGQLFRHCDVTIEKDYSQAAFYLAARGLGSDVTLLGLNPHSAQGDRVILEQIAQLAAPGAVTLDVSQCPDLLPALAVYAALRDGARTALVHAARLRDKECDRLDAVAQELNKLGARVEQGADFLTITGVAALHGGTVDSHNDHRIAMMLAVAATRATGAVTVTDAACVGKSYPHFWADYEALGGQLRREG